jgi:hypothetical protein
MQPAPVAERAPAEPLIEISPEEAPTGQLPLEVEKTPERTYIQELLEEIEPRLSKGFTYVHYDPEYIPREPQAYDPQEQIRQFDERGGYVGRRERMAQKGNRFFIKGQKVRVELEKYIERVYVPEPEGQGVKLPIDTLYLDRARRTALGTCERQAWREYFGGVVVPLGKNCMNNPDAVVNLNFHSFNPTTPADWLVEYQMIEPFEIQKEPFFLQDNREVTRIKLKQGQKEITLFISTYHRVPIRIEVKEKGQTIEQHTYEEVSFGVSDDKFEI